MFKRTSCSRHINVKIISYSSLLQIGDSCVINALSKALAVQREAEIFFGQEGDFAAYGVFYEPIPLEPIVEPVNFTVHNPKPFIKVNNIDIIGIAASSMLHIGNTQNVYNETRIKHIRQLLPTPHVQPEAIAQPSALG